MTHPVTRARTIADVDRDLTRHAWLLHLAVTRLVLDVARINWRRIDALLEERLALQQAQTPQAVDNPADSAL
jgi:hypothetical protein